jgi:hypothetical protein
MQAKRTSRGARMQFLCVGSGSRGLPTLVSVRVRIVVNKENGNGLDARAPGAIV